MKEVIYLQPQCVPCLQIAELNYTNCGMKRNSALYQALLIFEMVDPSTSKSALVVCESAVKTKKTIEKTSREVRMALNRRVLSV